MVMDQNRVDQVVSVDRRPHDPKMLKLFTVLAEGDEKERIKSTESLLQMISSKEAESDEGLSSDVEYTVNRLVKGLASSRRFARLGFSVALCQVLRSMDAVTPNIVLDTLEESSGVPKNSSKSETGNLYLGKIFGYLALIQSGKLFEGKKKHVRAVAEQLMTLSTEKSYLQQLCVTGMVQVIAKVKDKLYKTHIFPLIEKQFIAGWGDCSPDTFLLILYSNRYHMDTVKTFLKEHWMDEQLVSEKNFPLISDVVLRAASCYPIIHSVIDELVTEVITKGLSVVKFWKQVVHPLFEVKGTVVPKRAVGLHIFSKILPQLDTAEKLGSVLHPDVTSVLVRYHPQRNDDLASRSVALLTGLGDIVNASKDPAMQVTILKCLIKKPGSHHFDMQTKTNTIGKMVVNLLPEASIMFGQELMKTFDLEPTWMSKEEADRADVLAWCIKEMVYLVTNGNLPSPWQLRMLQFLLIRGFFKIMKASSDIPNCSIRRPELSKGLQQSIRDNFYKTTSKLLIHHKQGESRVSQFGASLDVLYQLVQYCQTLLDSPTFVQLDVPKFSEEAQEEWTKVVGVLKTVEKKRKAEEKIKDGHAFELLFIHEGFQLFQDPEGAIEMLQDLYVCYKKSGQRRKSKAKDDEPPWIDVITEVLLNLMFKDTVLSRNVAKVVMAALADHMTQDSIQLVVDALKQTGVDNEDGLIGMEDEEEMKDEDANENANDNEDEDGDGKKDKAMIDEDVPSSDSDENSDDEDDEDSGVEEEEKVTVADQLKDKVRAALGDAAAKSDDESEEEDADLSDNEMFKLDSVLAEAFRCMRKGKKNTKEKEKQLRIFKQRVMDLVEVLVKQSPSLMLIKMLLVPLIELMERGVRKQEDQTLGTKALSIYQLLCKAKKVSADEPSDRDELLALIGELMICSKKVSTPNLVKEVGKGCLLVIRTLLNIQDHTEPSPLKTRAMTITSKKHTSGDTKDHDYYQAQVVEVVRDGMLDMFNHKPGHCPPAFYQMLVERYPHIFWPIYTDLLSTVASADIKIYQRTQAALFLASMVNRAVVKLIGDENWGEFITTFQSTLAKVVQSMSVGEVKVSFVRELLMVTQKIQNISPEMSTQIMSMSVKKKLDTLWPSFNHDVKNIFKMLTRNLEKGGAGQKKRKKKHRENPHNSKSSPENNARIERPEELDNEASPSKKPKINGHSGNGQNDLNELSVESPSMKKRKKHKKSNASLDHSGLINSEMGDSQIEASSGDGVQKKAKLTNTDELNSSSLTSPQNGDKTVGSSKSPKFSPRYTRSKKRQKGNKITPKKDL